ncbi:hypothetical protein V6N12_061081 [Hibiscus sabdariffa]|uniref:Uncharacterized protein n=1 Tax=Hibiscus sabdariffa TaxID=183260 RepID=A0ABR2DW03_9ROSI
MPMASRLRKKKSPDGRYIFDPQSSNDNKVEFTGATKQMTWWYDFDDYDDVWDLNEDGELWVFKKHLIEKGIGVILEENMISWLEDSGVTLSYFELYASNDCTIVVAKNFRVGYREWAILIELQNALKTNEVDAMVKRVCTKKLENCLREEEMKSKN